MTDQTYPGYSEETSRAIWMDFDKPAAPHGHKPMPNPQDIENMIKAEQAAGLLLADLIEISKTTNNELLSHVAIGVARKVAEVKTELGQLANCLQQGSKT